MQRAVAIAGELGRLAERFERDFRMAGPFGRERQAARGGAAHRGRNADPSLCIDDVAEQRFRDLHRTFGDRSLGRLAAPAHDPLRQPRSGGVERERRHGVGDGNRITPLLDDLSGSLVDGTPTTHRKTLVRGDPHQVVTEPDGLRVDDHQVAELALPRIGIGQITAREHATGERPAHRRAEHRRVADELAAGHRELIDARREEAFDRLRIGIARLRGRARVRAVPDCVADRATARASSMR